MVLLQLRPGPRLRPELHAGAPCSPPRPARLPPPAAPAAAAACPCPCRPPLAGASPAEMRLKFSLFLLQMQRIFYDNHHDICRLSKRVFPRTEAPMADLARCGQGLVRSQDWCRREPQAGSLPGSSAPQRSGRVAACGLRCISRGAMQAAIPFPAMPGCHSCQLIFNTLLVHGAGSGAARRAGWSRQPSGRSRATGKPRCRRRRWRSRPRRSRRSGSSRRSRPRCSRCHRRTALRASWVTRHAAALGKRAACSTLHPHPYITPAGQLRPPRPTRQGPPAHSRSHAYTAQLT